MGTRRPSARAAPRPRRCSRRAPHLQLRTMFRVWAEGLGTRRGCQRVPIRASLQQNGDAPAAHLCTVGRKEYRVHSLATATSVSCLAWLHCHIMLITLKLLTQSTEWQRLLLQLAPANTRSHHKQVKLECSVADGGPCSTALHVNLALSGASLQDARLTHVRALATALRTSTLQGCWPPTRQDVRRLLHVRVPGALQQRRRALRQPRGRGRSLRCARTCGGRRCGCRALFAAAHQLTTISVQPLAAVLGPQGTGSRATQTGSVLTHIPVQPLAGVLVPQATGTWANQAGTSAHTRPCAGPGCCAVAAGDRQLGNPGRQRAILKEPGVGWARRFNNEDIGAAEPNHPNP